MLWFFLMGFMRLIQKDLFLKKPSTNVDGFSGGPDRIRTDDPHNANVMRSQLRYRPIPTELYP